MQSIRVTPTEGVRRTYKCDALPLKSSPAVGHRAAVACLLTVATFGQAVGQVVPVTLKYIQQPADSFVRILAPNSIAGWGVQASAPTVMTYDDSLGLYLYQISLQAGQVMQYKFHKHLNQSGTDGVWLSDPANPETNPADNNNSVLRVTNLFLFEMDWRHDEAGRAVEVSAGVFGTDSLTSLTFRVNGDSLDGMPFFDSANGIFRYQLPEPVSPQPLFELAVTDSEGREEAGMIGSMPVDVEDVARPAGVEDGINVDPEDPTTVTLSLFAPGKRFVRVIGDFNDWEVSEAYLMERDSLRADSVHFWLRLEGLDSGTEYAFQYLINGQLRVGDPYSTKILDPQNDPFLGDTYPDLMEYPKGKTTQSVTVFQTAEQPFEWGAADYIRPAQKDLVIYELLVRDFVAAHDFATLIDSLDYLERLGVNAIGLMPVAEFRGNVDWGYEPNFSFAPDKYYGPAVDLKRFIDACHARGIAVILDVVYNHQAYEAPFSRMYSESSTGIPGSPPSADNPWLNTVARHPFNVFNDVNHESPATKYWLDRVNEYWLREFEVDGFRFDLSKGFTQTNTGSNVGAWGNYDQTRINLLTRMADRIWEVDSTAYIILEHFAVDGEERALAEHGMDQGFPGMLVWNKMTGPYTEAAMGYNTGGKSDLSGTYYGTGGRNWPVPNLVTYMESHDEQWMMFKNLRYGACEAAPLGGPVCDTSNGGYSTQQIPVALDRMKLAGAFFLTIPGPRMIWQFGELGYGHGEDGRECLRPSNQANDLGECPAGTPIRTGEKPIHWEYLDDPLRSKLYKTWAALLRLRREHDAFRSEETVVTMSVRDAVKTVSLSHPDMDVAVVGNFAVTPFEGSPPFTSSGVWYDFFSGDSMIVSNLDTTLSLAAGEFHLFTNRKVDPPEPDLITVSSEPRTTPAAYRLDVETFPNPFQDTVGIRYTVEEAGPTTLMLFDSIGRQVTRVDYAHKSPGVHVETLDLSGVASGTYFVRVTTPGGFTTLSLTKAGS